MKQVKEKKITSFTDLVSWQNSHNLVLEIYRVTSAFPTSEQFGLTSQLRRSAVSVTSNLAEGFSRTTSADKKHFYIIAIGSLTDLQSQCLIALGVKYLSQIQFDNLAEKTIQSHKLIRGLIKSIEAGKGVYDPRYQILHTKY